jgi:YVTN family beta-propeller protein
MQWNGSVWKTSVAGFVPLASTTSGEAQVPIPTVVESVRTTMRRARARVSTLLEPLAGDTLFDIPLRTPVAPPPPAPPPARGTVPVGGFPVAVAVSPDGSRAYVVNSANASVSMLDTEAGTVAATIAVGRQPFGIALTPDGRRAYVANAGDDSVSVIDLSRWVVIATVAVGKSPYGVAVGAAERAYVTNQFGSSLSVIDSGAATARIALGGAPTGVAVSPDGSRAYVADNDEHKLIVIDTDTLTVITAIEVGQHPAQVAITPDGRQAYVTNSGGGSVSVIDLQSATVTETMLVSTHPIGVAVDARGRLAYVTALDASRLTGTLTVIDVATGTHVTSSAGAPYGVAVAPTGDHAYVTDFRASALSKIEARTKPINGDRLPRVGIRLLDGERSAGREAVRYIAVGRRADGVTADPDAGRAFIIHSDDNSVDVIDSTGEAVTVGVRAYPTAVRLSRDRARAYVTNYDDGTVSVIDTDPTSPSRNTVTATLDVGRCWATGLVFSGDGSRAYAVDETDGGVSMIDTAAASPTRDTVIARYELGEPLAALALAPNGRWIYAINHFDHAVFAANTNSRRIRSIPLPGFPYRIAVSPNGLRLYASLETDGSTCVVDTDSGSPMYHRRIARLRLAPHAPDPVFTVAGGRGYVLNSDTGSVSVIDTASSAVRSVVVGQHPCDVAVSPDARRAYVANFLDNSLSIIGSTDTVTATIPVGASPCRVTVSSDGTRAFVVNNRDDSVSVVDTAAARVVDTLAVGHNPFDVTLSADGTRACVHHRDGLSMVAV